jgi:hypothetical protein
MGKPIGAGWLNAPSLGSGIPDDSAKIMRFPPLPLRLCSKFLTSTPFLNAYEYRFYPDILRGRRIEFTALIDAAEQTAMDFSPSYMVRPHID